MQFSFLGASEGLPMVSGFRFATHFFPACPVPMVSVLPHALPELQGALKTKVTDPYVVGWFLGGQKSTRVGQIFLGDFFIVFLNSPHRETPKNVIKQNREKIGLGFFCRFFCKNFSTPFFCKTFFVVFLNSHRKETPEKAIKQKKVEEKRHRNFCRFSENFLGKSF
jgi:hypothetical protein